MLAAGGAVGGAAGSIVSQGVGLATGIQDKFSWNAVALSAIGGGIGGSGSNFGVGGSSIASNALRQGVANAITQGVSVATGLQDKFSWAGVAAAAVGAYAGARAPASPFNIARSGASLIADAATRSLIEGSNFGDNVRAALPSVIGQTVGSVIVERIAGTSGVSQNAGSQRRGGALSAIGDFLGFDGEFGYDGINGPTGAGRHLSIAGLGGAIGDFVGLDGQFGQQGLLQPAQVALEGDAGVYERQLALRNLGRAAGGAAKGLARGLGILAGPLVDFAFADPTGGGERITLIEGDAHLRIRQPHSDTLSFVLEQSEPGIFRTRWNAVGGVTQQWVDDNTDLHDGSPGQVFYVIPDETAAALGRPLPSRLIAAPVDTRTWQTPPSLDNRVMTGERDSARFVLLHYTSDAGLYGNPVGANGILRDMRINASIRGGPGGDAIYGTGVYLTDILPGTMSNRDLGFVLRGSETPPGRYANFVAVDVTGLRNIYKPNPSHMVQSHVYVYPGTAGLGLTGRLIAVGPNERTGGGR